jgi:hypothetical protein
LGSPFAALTNATFFARKLQQQGSFKTGQAIDAKSGLYSVQISIQKAKRRENRSIKYQIDRDTYAY